MRLALLVGVGLVSLALVSAAQAKDQLWWANQGGDSLARANLDGSGGSDFGAGGASVNAPSGTGFDLSKNRFYWIDNGMTPAIKWATLNGSAHGTLDTTGASFSAPQGLVVDVTAGKLFWADDDQISFANLNNSGGGTISTSGATVSGATGVAIDRTTGRIYWANSGDNTHPISSSRADSSGGGADLDTTGASPSAAEGPTLDVAGGTVYWANHGDFFISHASLAGGGGGEFPHQTGNFPLGTALDLAAGRLYTAAAGSNRIDFMNLDDGTVGNLFTTGATKSTPEFPSLLKKPLNTSMPHITGTPVVGNQLTCSHGMWAADNVGALLYRMPQNFTYAWLRNGAVIGGQTASTYTVRPADVGQGLRCRVTAKNAAGGTAKASAAVRAR
jgi:DNA-binding beta-propeller fold protein YncE